MASGLVTQVSTWAPLFSAPSVTTRLGVSISGRITMAPSNRATEAGAAFGGIEMTRFKWQRSCDSLAGQRTELVRPTATRFTIGNTCGFAYRA